MSTYENIRLPAEEVKPYRAVSKITGIPLTRLITLAMRAWRPKLETTNRILEEARKP
jgi:hypothetical protein